MWQEGNDLHVSIDRAAAKPKREWLVVKAKPALGKAAKKQRKK